MGLLAAGQLTLLDHAKRLEPNGKVATVAELLSKTNDILEDMVFMPGNLETGHRVTIRTGLPAVYWRSINQGIPSSKSRTKQVDEGCGMLEAFSDVDVDLLKLNGNTAAFRLSEDVAFIEAMNQQMARTLIYGNPAQDDKQFLGLQARYSSLSAGNSKNIIDAGGAGSDNTSIYLVCWGEQTCHGIFPKGSVAGLLHEDKGEQTKYESNGDMYQVMRTRYQWKNGLVVKDWRYVVRIANIDVSNLAADSGAADVVKLMSKAIDRLPNMNMGRCAFYANRTVYSALKIQSLNKSNSVLAIEPALTQFGTHPNQKMLSFLGIPLRLCDEILETESRVT